MDLKEEIIKLISSKQEGDYWDFKKKWYTNKGDLLHDIICMANNLVDRDCYIILGVINKTFEIVGVENDVNRKNTQNLVDFLKDKNFAGGIRPVVMVNQINIDEKILDIIVIKNSKNTPFYLTKNFEGVFSNHIYTRIQDTNTPKTSSADIDKIEYLWKKRFALNCSIMQKLNALLDDWRNWGIYEDSLYRNYFLQGGDFGNYDYILNRIHPEFRIEVEKSTYEKWDKETLKCFYINQTAGHYKAKIYYNNTLLYDFYLAHVDEYGKYIVVPCRYSLTYDNNDPQSYICFYYLLKDSLIGKVQKIITHGTFETGSRGFGKYWLPIFEDETEFKEYIDFCKSNTYLFKENFKNYEYCKGDEKAGAIFPMSNIINAYRGFIEFCICKKDMKRESFEQYFKYYQCLTCD